MSDELVTVPRSTLAQLEAKAAAHDEQQAAAAAPPTLAERFARFRARVAQDDEMQRAREGLMTKSKAAAAASADGQQFRILRGLSFRTGGIDAKGRPIEARVEFGDVVDATVLPPHGSGRCDAGCSMQGPHDWFLLDGVIEAYPPPPPGAVSLAPGEAGALTVVEDTAGAVSVAGQAPAKE